MTSTARAHGNGRHAGSSRLASAHLGRSCAALLDEFPALGRPERILTVSPRPFFRGRRCRHKRDERLHQAPSSIGARSRGLLEEHRFLAHLLAHGAPVPRVFASAAEETAIAMGDSLYEVHEIPAGVDLYEDAIPGRRFAAWPTRIPRAGARASPFSRARFRRSAPQAPPAGRQFHHFWQHAIHRGHGALSWGTPVAGSPRGVRVCAAQALELLTPFHAELAPLLPALAPSGPTTTCTLQSFWSDRSPDAAPRPY